MGKTYQGDDVVISNYVAVAEGVIGARVVGWYGSISHARDGAMRHNEKTGERSYVTEYGREVTGKLYAEFPARKELP